MMVDGVLNGLIVAGVLAMIALPIVTLAFLRLAKVNGQLNGRIAYQGQSLALQEFELRKRGAVPAMQQTPQGLSVQWVGGVTADPDLPPAGEG